MGFEESCCSLSDHHGSTKDSESGASTTISSSHDFQGQKEYPFLHGYIDKRTGVHYLNSSQQTEERTKTKPEPEKFTRETQLCEKRNQCWNTTRETWTQMDRSGLVLDSSRDYSLHLGCYEDSKVREEKRNKAAIIIQQYARRRHARCEAKKLRKYAKERSEEVKFLQAIGKMKLVAAKENREERIRTMMCRMSAPKKWELSNGRLVHVQTIDTLRASDLMRLYTALAKCSRTVDERMCVLGYIKWTVQEFDCQLTKELIQLIEREADLMYRNRPTRSLLGLRQRILDLFLKFVQVPKFNPEAVAFQCVPNDFDYAPCQTLRRQTVPICLHS